MQEKLNSVENFAILNAEPENYCSQAKSILSEVGTAHYEEMSRQDLLARIEDYEVLITRLGNTIDREVIDRGRRLRFIVTATTGLDHIDVAYAEEKGIQVLSLKGQTEFLKTVRATAELTVGLALSLIRHIHHAHPSVLGGVWDRDLFRGNELYGKTAGIIGMGRLGSIVAGYFKAFGMRVIGYDPHGTSDHLDEKVASLDHLLAESDLVSVHVSYDETTRGLLNGPRLSKMKTGSYLINTSRGGIIDESALLDELVSGRIAGAALDVLCGEPHIDSRHPLVAHAKENPNVLIVPHIGGNTYESFIKTEVFMAKLLKQSVEQERGGI